MCTLTLNPVHFEERWWETFSSHERYSQHAAPKVHYYSPNLTQAADCSVPVENILVGCGADEVIPEYLQCHLSFHIFC